MYNGLLIIDPQYDFCNPNGTLYVKGAELDMKRLGEFITSNFTELDDIYVTFDDHKRMDIAHPMWWSNGQSELPDPFTVITYADVLAGKWFARIPEYQVWSELYLKKLEDQGNYSHIIWPYHCIAGTQGASMDKTIEEALEVWGDYKCTFPEIIRKGMNPLTEHYSAVKAEVDTDDRDTQINADLVAELQLFDTIYVAGEAFSHCVANTVRDLVRYGVDPKNIIILKDCTSNVENYEAFGEAFQREMECIGMRFLNSGDINV